MDVALKEPWFVAVWPGMGGIAQIAGSYLAHTLGARPIAELSAEPWFDVRSVRVSAGLVQPAQRPRTDIFGWHHPAGGRDLAILVGEEQPADLGYRYSQAVVAQALELGATRVFTFAAMGTPIRPEASPRVFAAANRPELLESLRRSDLELLGEAEISGLNGVLLAAAAERGLGGCCLLGEFPYFASALANPKAAGAILRRFAALAGLSFDLSELDQRAVQMESLLTHSLRRLEQAARQEPPPAPQEPSQGLDPKVRARIEALFAEAGRDRSKALELKAELDRHGLFSRYEDRFLDLFRQAG